MCWGIFDTLGFGFRLRAGFGVLDSVAAVGFGFEILVLGLFWNGCIACRVCMVCV